MATKEENFGVLISSLNCKGSKNTRNFYGYVIPTMSLVLVAFIMTCHTSFILYNRWKKFNGNMNRTTAIKLGRAVRLNILCPFMSASIGILLFLIFGSKKSAALFLPFCYYVPPDKPIRAPINDYDEKVIERCISTHSSV
ncbi:6822_t:CDS:2 [Funneliformis geosporum]|uniref:1265_t:CDS:1 n=1 Tax=Funneliformis geosporum TaxID=1117311 RepID=A0A9W4SVF5_9GLOM|nr:6822_t:CDS:2 [Funneliformis geosporum]CAI2183033.1 1265_t:CDS:2 [Funneliformis geosporum]